MQALHFDSEEQREETRRLYHSLVDQAVDSLESWGSIEHLYVRLKPKPEDKWVFRDSAKLVQFSMRFQTGYPNDD